MFKVYLDGKPYEGHDVRIISFDIKSGRGIAEYFGKMVLFEGHLHHIKKVRL